MGSEISFSALTDVGRKREHNEDNFLVDRALGLYVVCDGMGGHAAGEVASALAVRTFHEEVKKDAEMLKDYTAGATGVAKVSKRDITAMLEFAVNRASARVYQEALSDEKKRGMGTTLVATVLAGDTAFITYVGDSRLYLLRDGILEQLTEDHNVYNELIKRKKMPREKVEQLAQKNAITRAVGVYEHVEPETIVLDLAPGDRLLLCSDGLYQYFEDDLDQLANQISSKDVEAGVRTMIETANELGGSDNITGILVGIGGADEHDVDRTRRLQLKRELLAKMRLFRPLSERELLRVLQVTDVLEYEAGEYVIQQGDTGEELFIVLEGKVDVFRGEAHITTLEQGSHVGEMALVRNQPRSASVRANGPTEMMVIRRRDFFELLRNEHALAVKLLWQFLGVVADRLAETSRELGLARVELAAEGGTEDLTEELFEDSEAEDVEMARPTLVAPFHAGAGEPVIDEGAAAALAGAARGPKSPAN